MGRRASMGILLLAWGTLTASEASTLSLRFYGHGTGGIDRVKIPIDAPARPADVGGDFTLEFWMKALSAENGAGACVPGQDGWINGNIIFDRDIYGAVGDYGDFGVSLFEDGLAFGLNKGASGNGLCGSTEVDDGLWHHVAVTRSASSGTLQLWVDGVLDATATGPTGDASYRNGRSTSYPNDPFLVIGAEKHDVGPAYPSFSGWVDEVRLSNVIRYSAPFTPPSTPFVPDANTVALYHVEEGPAGPCTGTVYDTSGAAGGPSNGVCAYGGSGTPGPVYSTDAAPIANLCGNGTLDSGESCDDGNLVDGDGCDSNCTPTGCGNGIVTTGEQCDDGNGVSGDGCEPDCTFSAPLLLSGQSLLVKDRTGDPARRKLAVLSRDPAVPAGNPTIAGATLRLGRGVAEVATMSLPAAGWKGVGKPPGSKGYAYKDGKQLLGPCKSARLNPGRTLRAVCTGPGLAFTLDEPAQTELAVDFRIEPSGLRSCLVFGGTVTKDVPATPTTTGQFKARLAPAAPSCPLP